MNKKPLMPILSFCILMFTFALKADDVKLPLVPLKQDTTYTCYAYASRSVLLYYHVEDVSIEEIIAYASGTMGGGKPLCSPIKPLAHYTVEGILYGKGGIEATCVGPLSFKEIKDNIDNKKPIPVSLKLKLESWSHIVDICGYNASDNIVWY
jgi:hypothetical protein